MPPEAVTNYDPEAEQAAKAAEKAAAAERPCSGCGRTPSQTKFYPSRPDKCVECINAGVKTLRDKGPKTYTKIEGESVEAATVDQSGLDPAVSAEIDVQPELLPSDPIQAPSATCTCRECGQSFEPYHNGSAVIINYCQECLKKKLKRGIRKAAEHASPTFVVTIDLEQDPEIFEALTADARRDRRNLGNQIITILERNLLPGGQQ